MMFEALHQFGRRDALFTLLALLITFPERFGSIRLKHKSEVFATFKKWTALVEKQTGRHVRQLRSDNGGEYNSSEFEKFCER